jgi:hypothetical protein
MPPRVTKIGAESVLHLDALEKWLNELGMDKYDRVHQAIEMVRAVENRVISSCGQPVEVGAGAPWEASTYLNAQVDVFEFLDIFDAFKSEPFDVIAPKIKRASSGPFQPIDERAETADARNIQFELSLAAEWRLNGLKIKIGEPDFTVSFGSTEFILECKRPYSEGSVRSNIRSAKGQLATHLENAKEAFGAIAISVSRIVVPPSHLLINTSSLPSVQRDPDRHLRALLAERNELGQPFEVIMLNWMSGLGRQVDALMKRVRWRNFEFHERIVGMYFHVAPPFMHPGGYGRLAVSTIGPIGNPGPAFMYLQTATDAAYNRGWSGQQLVKRPGNPIGNTGFDGF